MKTPGPTSQERRTPVRTLALEWLALLVLSAVCIGAMRAFGLPAAPLLGAMVAAALFMALRPASQIFIPRLAFGMAQSVIGLAIASRLEPGALGSWGLVSVAPVLAAALVIAISLLLGVALTRRQVLPATTAIWALSPGAASAMVILAPAYGANARLVALSQYLRVLVVTATAAVAAHLLPGNGHAATAAVAAPGWQPGTLAASAYGAGIVALSIGLSRRLRLPAGPLILSIVFGMLADFARGAPVPVHPAPELLAYALIGCSIGLQLRASELRDALPRLPAILMAIAALVGACALMAMPLVLLGHIDPLTALLATSPGGLDAIAIIASSSPVQVDVVMAFQFVRFGLVLLIGPAASRYVAARLDRKAAT